jgi:O-antigen ligase
MSQADSLAASFSHGVAPTAVDAAPVARRFAFSRSDARWDLLLVCLAGYTLVAVGRVHQLFPVIDTVRPVIATGLLSIVLYVSDERADRRLRWATGGTSTWLIALLVWSVLSIPMALIDGIAFDMVFKSFIKTVVMFFVVVGAIRGVRDIERLAGAYLIGCTAYAVVVLARFDALEGKDWRLGDLYYYDANDFATFAVTAMPLALYFAQRARRLWWRVLSLVALAVLGIAFVYSGSRGGFLALLATGLFVAVRYRSIAFGRRMTAMAVVGAVLIGAASDRYWQQMGTILTDTDYNQTAESGRLQIWSRGVGYMLTHPVFGVGAANFEPAEGILSPFANRQQWGVGVKWNAPHNSFLQIGAELGIPGLIIFVAMIGSALLALHRLERRSRRRSLPPAVPPQLVQALMASLIGFVVGAFFLSLAYSELLYMLLALAVGARKVARIRRPVPVSASPVAA